MPIRAKLYLSPNRIDPGREVDEGVTVMVVITVDDVVTVDFIFIDGVEFMPSKKIP